MKCCPHCSKDIPEREGVAVDKVSSRGSPRLGRVVMVFLVLFYIALIVVGVIYEREAGKILDYAREVEEKEKYEVASMAYRTVADKYPWSYSAGEAIEGLSQIDEELLSFELSESEPVRSGGFFASRFDPYLHYGLPLAVSLICSGVCVLVILVRVVQFRFSTFTFFLAMLSVLFLAIQLVAYGWWDFPGDFYDVSVKVMGYRGWVYVVSYALLLVTAIETLRKKKELDC